MALIRSALPARGLPGPKRARLSVLPLLLAAEVLLGSAPTNRIAAVQSDQSLCSRIAGRVVLYQPLMWLGTAPPAEAENQALWAALEQVPKRGLHACLPALEDFLQAHPDSPWTPSLRVNLGRYYADHGRYHRAIEHWQAAWSATKTHNGPAKQLADFAFAHCTRLLAGLGDLDSATLLFREAEGRVFENAQLQRMVNATRNACAGMSKATDLSFRCGVYALSRVAGAIKGSAANLHEIAREPSPSTGFSMAKLLELAQRAGLDLEAVQWEQPTAPIVPCVIHWKDRHYAAVIAERNGLYQVVDPVFDKPRWIEAADILDEASGAFLIPKGRLSPAWKPLAAAQAGEIYGRGTVGNINNGYDACGNGSGGSSSASAGPISAAAKRGAPCASCGGGNGGSATGGSGTSCSNCPALTGMPVWEVSEPYINLWLYDEPLGYQPGLGDRVSFRLAYKQLDTRTISTNVFSLGPNWNCSWLSYVVDDDGQGLQATLILPGGGERDYVPDGVTSEYFSRTRLLRNTNTLGNLTGFVLTYANGAQDLYQLVFTNSSIATNAFLTAKLDPFGHATRFYYQETNQSVKLLYVVDGDGRTNTLSYTNTFLPTQITGVTDPFGNSVILQYDTSNTNAWLTNVINPLVLSSSFAYDSEGNVTNLSTPYGNTKFETFDNGFYGQSGFIRAIRVLDAAGATNVYMLEQTATLQYLWPLENFVGNYGDEFPPNIPSPNLDLIYMYTRDTFHWGPRQAGSLPINLTTLVNTNYLQGRMCHWLHDATNSDYISQTLASKIEPSPDGTTVGQATFYDYDGQSDSAVEGTNSSPRLVFRILPDSTVRCSYIQRNPWGRATNALETYSTGYGISPLTRSNQFVYATNGVDLVLVLGAQGETRGGYAYDTNHHLLRATNAVNDLTSYTYDSQGRLTSTKSPAGLTTTNLYFSGTSYSNWIQQTIDIEIGRTNSFTYTNDLLWTRTNERGLTTTNSWDALQRLTSSSDSRGTNLYFYNKLDLARSVNRMGFTNSFGYDAVRRLTASTNAEGACTLYSYCTCGSLDWTRDPVGNYTFFSYDNAGRLIQAVYADEFIANYAYDLVGQITNVTDSSGFSITNWFDNQGLLYAISNAFGQQQVLAFDIEDRLTNSIDPNGVEFFFTCDPLGRLLTRTNAVGGEQFAYAPTGLVAYTNPLGLATFYAYDVAQRKTFETNANQEVTQFHYDPSGNLTNLIDGKGQNTSWGFDLLGRVTTRSMTSETLCSLMAMTLTIASPTAPPPPKAPSPAVTMRWAI